MTLGKRLTRLEERFEAVHSPERISVAFAPFPGVSDKYCLTEPQTGERVEFDTEEEMLKWLNERRMRHILVRTVDGRRPRKEKNGAGILLVPPRVTEEQWETAARGDMA